MGDVYTNPPQSRNEAILRAIIDGIEYTDPPQSRIEDLLLELKEAIEQGGTGEDDMKKSVYDSDDSVASAGGIKMFVNQKIGTLPQRVGSLETTAGVLQGEVASIEDTLDTLGTAAKKNATNAVTAGSTDLVESGAVKTAIDTAVASAYKPAGSKTCAELTSALLVDANYGNVYNMSDSGTTTADFAEGAGHPIRQGDNVGIVKIDNVYKFDILSGFVDTSGFQTKTITGTVEGQNTVEGALSALSTNKQDALGLYIDDDGYICQD